MDAVDTEIEAGPAPTLKEIAGKRTDIFWVSPSDIKEKPGWNCRVDSDPANQAYIVQLALSIKQVGVKEPLTVFRDDDGIWLVEGHCRLRAVAYATEVLGAEIKRIPVKTDDRRTDEANRVLRQALDGKPKTTFELGIVYTRLMGYGWTLAEIASKVGKTEQTIKDALDLQGASKEVKELVTSGQVSATVATRAVQAKGAEAAAELKTGVAKAKSEGKKKATARHVPSAKRAEPKSMQIAASLTKTLRTIADEIEQAADLAHTGLVIEIDTMQNWARRIRAVI
jgi:ParB-like chromosome segregation protein Spo0J